MIQKLRIQNEDIRKLKITNHPVSETDVNTRTVAQCEIRFILLEAILKITLVLVVAMLAGHLQPVPSEI